MAGIPSPEAEISLLRAEFLDLMSRMAETPAEARAYAGRMEDIRNRIAELSPEYGCRPPAEMKGAPTEESLLAEMESISGEIETIRTGIKEAEASSDFSRISRLAMSASVLESRRRHISEEIGRLRSERFRPTC